MDTEGQQPSWVVKLTIFWAYGVGNLYLMMWAGFGGLERLVKGSEIYSFYALCLYPPLCLMAIYLPLAKLPENVRKLARNAILVPWAFILLIVIPQVPHQFQDNSSKFLLAQLFIFLGVPAAIWFVYIPGEALVRWLSRRP